MTDKDLVEKNLSYIESRIRELQTIAVPENLQTDVREERFVEHTLQLAIQAMLNVASHIISDERLGEPESNRQMFDLLVQNKWLDQSLAMRLRSMAGFRNILVHGYTNVDLDIVRDVLENHLDDFRLFVKIIRERCSQAS